MRFIIATAALAAFTVPALAGVLPIDGRYCGEDLGVSASSIGGEDGSCALTRITASGSNWWLVRAKCDDGTVSIRISRDETLDTLSVAFPEDAEPQPLKRCN